MCFTDFSYCNGIFDVPKLKYAFYRISLHITILDTELILKQKDVWLFDQSNRQEYKMVYGKEHIIISSEGMACERTYKHVTECMAKHNGQISPCKNEWDAFKTCHAEGGHSDEHSF